MKKLNRKNKRHMAATGFWCEARNAADKAIDAVLPLGPAREATAEARAVCQAAGRVHKAIDELAFAINALIEAERAAKRTTRRKSR